MSDPSAYARQIETYLCRKNGGHLIRVVGPAFEIVSSWAAQGVPLKVAFRGIDRCCERYERKGPRRRPIRIEFCEADVLDAFESWRRAVGVSAGPAESAEARSRKSSLAAHVERAIARLAHIRGSGAAATDLHRAIEDVIRQLEEIAGAATRVRGEARAEIISRLAELDSRLMRAAIDGLDRERSGALLSEAREELAPFAGRMTDEIRRTSEQAAFTRVVREHAGLPTLRYE